MPESVDKIRVLKHRPEIFQAGPGKAFHEKTAATERKKKNIANGVNAENSKKHEKRQDKTIGYQIVLQLFAHKVSS
jgi:hypothetical protein